MNDILKRIVYRIEVAILRNNGDTDVTEGQTISTLKKCAIELLAELERQDLPEIKID